MKKKKKKMYSKLYSCNMSLSPVPFLWFSNIFPDQRLPLGFSSLVFPPPSIVCLPGPLQHKFCTRSKFIGRGELVIPGIIAHQIGDDPQRPRVKRCGLFWPAVTYSTPYVCFNITSHCGLGDTALIVHNRINTKFNCPLSFYWHHRGVLPYGSLLIQN